MIYFFIHRALLLRLSLYNLFIQATTRLHCDSPLIPFDSITRFRLQLLPPVHSCGFTKRKSQLENRKTRRPKWCGEAAKIWNQVLISKEGKMICEWMIRVGWTVRGISLLSSYFELAHNFGGDVTPTATATATAREATLPSQFSREADFSNLAKFRL